MNNVLKMALVASTLMTASAAFGKIGDDPRKSDPPTKRDPTPAHCTLGKVAMNTFDGCPNEATLCSQLISRNLVSHYMSNFSPSGHTDISSHRAALQNCLVKFEREVLGN